MFGMQSSVLLFALLDGYSTRLVDKSTKGRVCFRGLTQSRAVIVTSSSSSRQKFPVDSLSLSNADWSECVLDKFIGDGSMQAGACEVYC